MEHTEGSAARLFHVCEVCDDGLVDDLPCSRCGGYRVVLTPDGCEVARLLLALGVQVPAARTPIEGWTIRGAGDSAAPLK